MNALDDILQRLSTLPEDQRKAVVADAYAATKDARFLLTRPA